MILKVMSARSEVFNKNSNSYLWFYQASLKITCLTISYLGPDIIFYEWGRKGKLYEDDAIVKSVY